MLTIFSIPKPFEGEIGNAQRRAIASARRFADRVLLVGDDSTVAEAAALAGVEQFAGGARNEFNTPLLDAAFAQAKELAADGLCCFANADILLGDDLLAAARAAADSFSPVLVVGQSRDLVVDDDELADPSTLRARALREGMLRGPTAIDWFVFTPELFHDFPPFLVGRSAFDNWMIWSARQAGAVVDATEAVVAIHQPHDYSHLRGGKSEAYYGPEAEWNMRLAGGGRHIYTLYDASHIMKSDLSIRRNFASTFRLRESLRKAAWKVGIR